MMCKFCEKGKDSGRGSHVANEGERKEFNFTGIEGKFQIQPLACLDKDRIIKPKNFIKKS